MEESIAMKLYGVSSIPTKFLVSKTGKITYAAIGIFDEQALNAALREEGLKL